MKSYFGSEGRTYDDACSCATAIFMAHSNLTDRSMLDDTKKYLAMDFRDSVCSAAIGGLHTIPSESLEQPLLPPLTPKCVRALHDVTQFEKVSTACLPATARKLMDQRGDPASVGFQATLTYGAVEVFARKLYEKDAEEGSPCWKNHYEEHTNMFCDSTCGSAVDEYFEAPEKACKGQALRPLNKYPVGLTNEFHGRRPRPNPPLNERRVTFTYSGSDQCQSGDGALLGRKSRIITNRKVGVDVEIEEILNGRLSENRKRCGRETVLQSLSESELSEEFMSPHLPYVALLELLEDSRPSYASDLRTAFHVTRSALCARAEQGSDWWGTFDKRRETYCEVEAWKVFGASGGRFEMTEDGKPTGWILRPGFESYLLGGWWPGYRLDSDTCS
ncbi:hypothetical protein HDU93_002891, partial [Gonapodya sp. JEL0774]